VECKHQEKTRIYDWMQQAERDAADTGRIPAVHHRKNRQAPLVTIRLDDFIALLKSSIAV